MIDGYETQERMHEAMKSMSAVLQHRALADARENNRANYSANSLANARHALVAVALSMLAACNSAEPPPPAATTAPPYLVVTDLKQLMAWVIEPNAQIVWKSVGTIITEAGTEEIAPKTDADWEAIRNSAATVAEAGNLLMMEGRARNQDDWMKKARALIDNANIVLQAIDAKDAPAVFTAGSDLYISCSECHQTYAFPQNK